MKNVIAWFDVPTHDFDRAVLFYSEILAEKVRVEVFMGRKLGFFPMDKDGAVGGAIVPPDPNHVPCKDGTRVYLNCAGRLDQALARVQKAGGQVLEPKRSIGEQGWIAVIKDSEGNSIGLHSPVKG